MKASTLKHIKNTTAIILVSIVFGIGFLSGKRYCTDIGIKENIVPTNHQRKRSLRYCRAYVENFDQYCLHKSGTYKFSAYGFINEPDGYLYVKEFCPEMYLEYIAPVKHVWDSLKLTKMDWNVYDIRNKNKIKVKDSKNVYINTDAKKEN